MDTLFAEQAMESMLEIGMPLDEAETLLEDFINDELTY